jgi:hypothetical protein
VLGLAVVASFSLLASAGAEDAKTYDLSRRDRWQAGDVRTVTATQKQTQKTLVKGPDGSVMQDQEQRHETKYVVVQKVLEADDEGHITKSRVLVKEWRRTSGETEDTSLTGALVEVTGRGKARTWTVLAPAKAPEGQAKQWLDGEYGSKTMDEEVARRAMLPKTPIAVGGTWEADVGPLADAVSENLPVDRSKAKMTGALDAVEGGVARITLQGSLPLTGLPTPGGTLPFTEGGEFKLVVTASQPLEGRVAGSTSKGEQSLQGVADAGGAAVTLDVRVEQEEVQTMGGEVPEPPAAPAGAEAPKEK